MSHPSLAHHLRREAEGLLWFEPTEPLAGIGRIVMTTRQGGISREPYASLNLGFHVGDVPERVRLNRKAVLRALGGRLLEPVLGEQTHGNRVGVVGELHAGTRWEQPERSLAGTDALVTATRRLPLVILVADCLPIALVDPVRQVGAAVHAGWRGLADGILENTLQAMRQTWGTVAEDVSAWIGPGIGPCCYAVGPEVGARFPESTRPLAGGREDASGVEGEAPGGARLDLRAEARRRLLRAGLVEENLTGLALCTACRPEWFFSHRRDTRAGRPATGRQAMLLWLERPA